MCLVHHRGRLLSPSEVQIVINGVSERAVDVPFPSSTMASAASAVGGSAANEAALFIGPVLWPLPASMPPPPPPLSTILDVAGFLFMRGTIKSGTSFTKLYSGACRGLAPPRTASIVAPLDVVGAVGRSSVTLTHIRTLVSAVGQHGAACNDAEWAHGAVEAEAASIDLQCVQSPPLAAVCATTRLESDDSRAFLCAATDASPSSRAQMAGSPVSSAVTTNSQPIAVFSGLRACGYTAVTVLSPHSQDGVHAPQPPHDPVVESLQQRLLVACRTGQASSASWLLRLLVSLSLVDDGPGGHLATRHADLCQWLYRNLLTPTSCFTPPARVMDAMLRGLLPLVMCDVCLADAHVDGASDHVGTAATAGLFGSNDDMSVRTPKEVANDDAGVPKLLGGPLAEGPPPGRCSNTSFSVTASAAAREGTLIVSAPIFAFVLLQGRTLQVASVDVILTMCALLRLALGPHNAYAAVNARRLWDAKLIAHLTYGLSRHYVAPAAMQDLMSLLPPFLAALGPSELATAAVADVMAFVSHATTASGGDAPSISTTISLACGSTMPSAYITVVRNHCLKALWHSVDLVHNGGGGHDAEGGPPRRSLLTCVAEAWRVGWQMHVFGSRSHPVGVALAVRLIASLSIASGDHRSAVHRASTAPSGKKGIVTGRSVVRGLRGQVAVHARRPDVMDALMCLAFQHPPTSALLLDHGPAPFRDVHQAFLEWWLAAIDRLAESVFAGPPSDLRVDKSRDASLVEGCGGVEEDALLVGDYFSVQAYRAQRYASQQQQATRRSRPAALLALRWRIAVHVVRCVYRLRSLIAPGGEAPAVVEGVPPAVGAVSSPPRASSTTEGPAESPPAAKALPLAPMSDDVEAARRASLLLTKCIGWLSAQIAHLPSVIHALASAPASEIAPTTVGAQVRVSGDATAKVARLAVDALAAVLPAARIASPVAAGSASSRRAPPGLRASMIAECAVIGFAGGFNIDENAARMQQALDANPAGNSAEAIRMMQLAPDEPLGHTHLQQAALSMHRNIAEAALTFPSEPPVIVGGVKVSRAVAVFNQLLLPRQPPGSEGADAAPTSFQQPEPWNDVVLSGIWLAAAARTARKKTTSVDGLRCCTAVLLYGTERFIAGLPVSAALLLDSLIACYASVSSSGPSLGEKASSTAARCFRSLGLDAITHLMSPAFHLWSVPLLRGVVELVYQRGSLVFGLPLPSDHLRNVALRLGELTFAALPDFEATTTATAQHVGELWHRLVHANHTNKELSSLFTATVHGRVINAYSGGIDLLLQSVGPIEMFLGWFVDNRYHTIAVLRAAAAAAGTGPQAGGGTPSTPLVDSCDPRGLLQWVARHRDAWVADATGSGARMAEAIREVQRDWKATLYSRSFVDAEALRLPPCAGGNGGGGSALLPPDWVWRGPTTLGWTSSSAQFAVGSRGSNPFFWDGRSLFRPRLAEGSTEHLARPLCNALPIITPLHNLQPFPPPYIGTREGARRPTVQHATFASTLQEDLQQARTTLSPSAAALLHMLLTAALGDGDEAPPYRVLYASNMYLVAENECIIVVGVVTTQQVVLISSAQLVDASTPADVVASPFGGAADGEGTKGTEAAGSPSSWCDIVIAPARGKGDDSTPAVRTRRKTTRLVIANLLRRYLPLSVGARSRILSSDTDAAFAFSQHFRRLRAAQAVDSRRSGRDELGQQPLLWVIPLHHIASVTHCNFQNHRAGLELGTHGGSTWFLVALSSDFTMSRTQRDVLADVIAGAVSSQLSGFSGSPRTAITVDNSTALKNRVAVAQRRWLRRQISTTAYLAIVNAAASRTVCDLSQYPVVPWVVADYSVPPMSATEPPTCASGAAVAILGDERARDLSKPVGALNATRAAELIARFNDWMDDSTPPFHHGTHYSTSAIVLYYLVRLQPHATLSAKYQGGRLDVADRLFHSFEDAWRSSSSGRGDTKELVPECYALPEALTNLNRVDLGTRASDGVALGDVTLPVWCDNNPFAFTHLCRQALESETVAGRLHLWMDLIFGCKQQGPDAVAAVNVFHQVSYEDGLAAAVTAAARNEEELRAIVARVDNFGITPRQVFKHAHPSRTSAAGGGAAQGLANLQSVFINSIAQQLTSMKRAAAAGCQVRPPWEVLPLSVARLPAELSVVGPRSGDAASGGAPPPPSSAMPITDLYEVEGALFITSSNPMVTAIRGSTPFRNASGSHFNGYVLAFQASRPWARTASATPPPMPTADDLCVASFPGLSIEGTVPSTSAMGIGQVSMVASSRCGHLMAVGTTEGAVVVFVSRVTVLRRQYDVLRIFGPPAAAAANPTRHPSAVTFLSFVRHRTLVAVHGRRIVQCLHVTPQRGDEVFVVGPLVAVMAYVAAAKDGNAAREDYEGGRRGVRAAAGGGGGPMDGEVEAECVVGCDADRGDAGVNGGHYVIATNRRLWLLSRLGGVLGCCGEGPSIPPMTAVSVMPFATPSPVTLAVAGHTDGTLSVWSWSLSTCGPPRRGTFRGTWIGCIANPCTAAPVTCIIPNAVFASVSPLTWLLDPSSSTGMASLAAGTSAPTADGAGTTSSLGHWLATGHADGAVCVLPAAAAALLSVSSPDRVVEASPTDTAVGQTTTNISPAPSVSGSVPSVHPNQFLVLTSD